MTRSRLSCVVLAAALTAASPRAQSPEQKPVAFEVASIKPSANLDSGGTLRMLPGGSFRAVNVDARNLILSAYRTADRRLFAAQLIGAPSWLSTERFDISARVSDAIASRPQEELFGMLPVLVKSLLEDRFKLAAHRELKEMPGYWLVVAKGGFKLKPV